MQENGIYRIRITAAGRHTHAVIVIRDGCIDGGGASSIYQGTWKQDGTQVIAKLTVLDWDADEAPLLAVRPLGAPSVLTLSGTSDADGFHLTGKGRYTTVIEVSGRRVAPLTEPRRP